VSPEDVVWYSILHSLKRLLPVLGCSPAVARKSICAAFYRTASATPSEPSERITAVYKRRQGVRSADVALNMYCDIDPQTPWT
jgi:hypothetical protein